MPGRTPDKPRVLVQTLVPPEHARLLDAEAHRDRRSRSALLRIIVERWASQVRTEQAAS